MKFKTYKGEILHNCEVSYKIDGVRAHRLEDGNIVSRAGKPLYNVDMECEVAEIFLGTWEDTVSAVRTHQGKPVDKKHIYSLSPLDSRLLIGHKETLSSEEIYTLMDEVVKMGYEGLVISTPTYKYKVKPVETYDVTVLDIVEGTGKYVNMLGAVLTEKGKVGTGFTDEQRQELYSKDVIGKTIEVEAMSLTPSGKFRHPRFLRVRWDKDGMDSGET